MKKFIVFLIFSFFISTSLFAKTLEQKKDELKKIYEAGGISKIEYKKAVEFLEKPKEKEKKSNSKKKYSIKKKKTNSKKFFSKKDKDKDDEEEITLKKIEELGTPVNLDNSYFTTSMIKKFKGCNNSLKCKGGKAGGQLFRTFNKSKSYSQRNPGEMIKAMAMYEVFYASKLWYARKSIKRFMKQVEYQR